MSGEVFGPGSPYAGEPGSGRFTSDEAADADTGPLPRVTEEGVALGLPPLLGTWRGRELRAGGGPVEIQEDPKRLPWWVAIAVIATVLALGGIGYLVLERL